MIVGRNDDSFAGFAAPGVGGTFTAGLGDQGSELDRDAIRSAEEFVMAGKL